MFFFLLDNIKLENLFINLLNENNLNKFNRKKIIRNILILRRNILIIQPSWLGLQNTPTASLKKGKTPPPNEYHVYDTKQFDGEVPVLVLWRISSPSSLPLSLNLL